MLRKSHTVLFALVAMTATACATSADRVIGAGPSVELAADLSVAESAFMRNSAGTLHNDVMARVFHRLNGRRSTDRRAICLALFDVVNNAPEIKNPGLRRRMIDAIFGLADDLTGEPRSVASLKGVNLSDECGGSLAFRLVSVEQTATDLPCDQDCGGNGGGEPTEPTYSLSTSSYSRSHQIAGAARDAASQGELEAQLTSLTTVGTSGFNVVEMDMLESHTALARASYQDAAQSAQSFQGACTDDQKRAKGRNIRDGDVETFIGVVGTVYGGSWVSTALARLAWKEVFAGATVAAGAVSAYRAVLEVSTPCN